MISHTAQLRHLASLAVCDGLGPPAMGPGGLTLDMTRRMRSMRSEAMPLQRSHQVRSQTSNEIERMQADDGRCRCSDMLWHGQRSAKLTAAFEQWLGDKSYFWANVTKCQEALNIFHPFLLDMACTYKMYGVGVCAGEVPPSQWHSGLHSAKDSKGVLGSTGYCMRPTDQQDQKCCPMPNLSAFEKPASHD